METLYDSILEDMGKEGFTVGDKYKSQYEELGKTLTNAVRQFITRTSTLLPSLSFKKFAPHSLTRKLLQVKRFLCYLIITNEQLMVTEDNKLI